MAEYTFQCQQKDDRVILETIEKLFSETTIPIQAFSFTTSLTGTFNAKENLDKASGWIQDHLRDGDRYFTALAVVSTVGQPNTGSTLRLTINRASNDWYDKVVINESIPNLPPQEPSAVFQRLTRAVTEAFPPITPSLVLSTALGADAQAHYLSRETLLRRQEELLAGFFAKTQGFVLEQSKNYREQQAELEKRHEERLASLDEANRKRQEELDRLKETLESRAKELDDRDNTHARRQTYKEITQKIKDRSTEFKLTEGTRHLRIAPLVTTGVVFVTLLVAVGFSIWGDRSTAPLIGWFPLARQLILTASAGVTATFLIRIQQRYFQRLADEEFRLKRLDLDIDRATWLVELALEWKAEKGEEMPKELVDRLSRNLFADDGDRDTDIHPLETLASALLGHAGSATVELPGGKANFARNDIKRMGKEEPS